jgi:hypothetical protein
MKKLGPDRQKKSKPPKELVEKVARQLCQRAGHNPDGVIVWEGEYGYSNYNIPMWHRFTAEARKLIAEGQTDA